MSNKRKILALASVATVLAANPTPAAVIGLNSAAPPLVAPDQQPPPLYLEPSQFLSYSAPATDPASIQTPAIVTGYGSLPLFYYSAASPPLQRSSIHCLDPAGFADSTPGTTGSQIRPAGPVNVPDLPNTLGLLAMSLASVSAMAWLKALRTPVTA